MIGQLMCFSIYGLWGEKERKKSSRKVEISSWALRRNFWTNETLFKPYKPLFSKRKMDFMLYGRNRGIYALKYRYICTFLKNYRKNTSNMFSTYFTMFFSTCSILYRSDSWATRKFFKYYIPHISSKFQRKNKLNILKNRKLRLSNVYL